MRSLCLSVLVLSLGFQLFGQQDRLRRTIDGSRTVVLKGNRHPGAQPQYDLGPVDAALEIPYVTLQLKPSPAQQSALDLLLAEQQIPSSPNFHKWLTPEQYGDSFGLSRGDVARITSWLQASGLKVNDVARGRHWITFTGTAGRIAGALHTEIHHYRSGSTVRRANASDPSVPADLADMVAGIQGLDDFPEKSDRVSVPMDIPQFTNGSTHSLAPDDFAIIYHLDALYQAGIDGTGQKIAVIGRTDINVADVRTFRSRYNLPVNDPQVVLFGPDPGSNADDQGEAYLDIEWAGAVARKATILYVNSTSVRTSAQYAIDQDLAKVMTFSYGSCEQATTPTLRAIAQQAAVQGITWMASAGDSGANSCDPHGSVVQSAKGRGASFPASIPEVTAVGGTMFNEGTTLYWATSNRANGDSVLSYIPEKVWNETGTASAGLLAGGGGQSIFFAKPSWQNGPGVPNDNARAIPDLSMTASLHDGYRTFHDNATYLNAGTSASTPAFAGIVAMLNQYLLNQSSIPQAGLGNINPTLYRLAQRTTDVFHDVTTGDNLNPCVQLSPGCVNGFSGNTAGPNYDLATGLGSLDAFNLVTKWAVKTENTTTKMTTSVASLDWNGSVQLIATVSAAGSATPSGTVSFTDGTNDTALGTATLASGTATLTVPGNILPLGVNTVYALYSGDANFNGSSAAANVGVNIPANGSVVLATISPNPVYQSAPDAQGFSWFYTITLRELAGTATTLTSFTINGTPVAISSFFSSTTIPAKGTLTAGIRSSGLTVPTTRVYAFAGADGTGRTWSQQVTVTFQGPGVLTPAMLFTSPSATVQQDPSADPSCQWSQPVYLQEENGYTVQLTKLTAAGKDISNLIQSIFGATRLAPFGTLQGTICWSGITAPQTLTTSIVGVPDGSGTLTASMSTTFAAAAGAPSQASLSSSLVSMAVGDSTQTATGSTNLTFSSASTSWTASVVPSGRTTNWLQLSQTSGTGSGTLSFKASGAGLSNGVYNATVAIQAAGAVPQFQNITVTFTVGAVSGMTIGAAANVFSNETAFAPGMLLAIYGNQLAGFTQTAASLPLPLTMNGVSATVNGVSAPLYYVSPTQFDIQVPYETGSGPAVIAINNGGKVASFVIAVDATAPGLWPHFLNNATGALATTAKVGDVLITFMTGDGDITPSLANGAVPPASTAVKNLPQPRMPVTITVGGVPATVLFSGITSAAPGVNQIDFTVPSGVKTGVPLPVVVTVGSVSATALTLTVQ